MWVRFRFCWARRRAGPGLAAPPLLPVPVSISASSSSTMPHPNSNGVSGVSTNGQTALSDENTKTPYPYLIFFKTAEEAAAALQKRRDAVPPYPISELETAWAAKERESKDQEPTS
jgi:hypothetical protein